MLEVRALEVSLGHLAILSGLDLHLRAGHVTAIVGPNGSGKTTLLRTLTGDLPYRGQVRLNGCDIACTSVQDQAEMRGVLAQSTAVSFPFTALEVVSLGLRGGEGEARARAALGEVGLAHLADRPLQQLSGGEQSRVHLARVLVQVWEPVCAKGPRWLFLDEPVAALDIGHQLGVMGLARRYADGGGGVVAVLHDLNLAAMYADHIVLMRGGKILAEGPPADVLIDPHLSTAYGCHLRVNQAPSVGPWILPQAARA